MSESKVYMFPENYLGCNNHDAALWATLANRRDDSNPLATAAMMNGGMNSWANNPFIYLVWMMFANRFFGNGYGENGQNAQNIEVQGQLAALRELMNNNQNSNLLMDAIKGNGTAIGQLASQLNCDFNTLNSAICDVRGGIDKVAGLIGFSAERVINAVQAGDCQISRQLSECCCNVREAITRGNYENQIATLNQTNTLLNNINTVATGQERGFSSLGYAAQQQTCDITKAIADSTALILAGQKAAEMRELQREIQTLRDEKNTFQSSALIQQLTLNLINQLRPCPIPAYITCNPFGCQGDNYSYGIGNCGC